MNLSSKLLPRDSPLKDESNDPTNTSREAQKSRAERNRNYGQNSYSVWRRKEMSVIATRGNRPPAQVGEESSQEPAARLTDLNKNQICTASTHSMAEPPSEDTPQPVDPRKVLVKIPTALFDNLHTTPATDVLLLQEVKLPEAACLKQARFIETKGGISLWNEASFSAQTGRFKGGTGIVLSAKMATLITHHGILFPAGKSPGTDTIPAELYQALWEDIDGDILNFVVEFGSIKLWH